MIHKLHSYVQMYKKEKVEQATVIWVQHWERGVVY